MLLRAEAWHTEAEAWHIEAEAWHIEAEAWVPLASSPPAPAWLDRVRYIE